MLNTLGKVRINQKSFRAYTVCSEPASAAYNKGVSLSKATKAPAGSSFRTFGKLYNKPRQIDNFC